MPTKNKGEWELVKTPLKYETKTTGKFLMNGFMDVKFVLKGGAFFEVLVDESTNISGETYIYDQQGNWTNYEYWMVEEEGQKVKKKEKRYIEYWK